jgi:hypothetical protein
MNEIIHLGLFVLLFFLAYLIFRRFSPSNIDGMEGMSDASGNNTASATNAASPDNGVAGNAASYAAAIKASNIRSMDVLLINKYRADYEAAILNVEDFINCLMLQTTLSVDHRNNPMAAIDKLGSLQQAKTALNSVMKFVDSSS